MTTRKTVYGIQFILVIGLLLFAYYLEYWHGILPCPLCLLQRFCFYALAFMFLVSFVTDNALWTRISYNTLICFFAILGIIISCRQLYLQHLPPGQAPGCAADITYLLQTFSLPQVLSQVFQGSAECAVSQWIFLGLDMAAWALIWYVIFLITALYLLFRKKP